jgi:hypothetical protein
MSPTEQLGMMPLYLPGVVPDALPRSSATRTCGWCKASIRAAARRDSIYCSQGCRQAAHRFHKPSRLAARTTLAVDSGLPRRFAYADPPYPSLARRYYADHPDFGGEVDHAELVSRLACRYDGWALSTSAAALPEVLALCPSGTRVAAWFRGERPTASYAPLSSWEPVLYFGARRVTSRPGEARRLDALVYVARPRLTDPRRVIGTKPAAFCAWLFLLLGARAGDEFVDLFPGSGGVSASWETYCSAAVRHDASFERAATE